ncbi:hypothetical protein BGZ63DRAFT_389104, partial [Mariannaea sp. PMI_226]
MLCWSYCGRCFHKPCSTSPMQCRLVQMPPSPSPSRSVLGLSFLAPFFVYFSPWPLHVECCPQREAINATPLVLFLYFVCVFHKIHKSYRPYRVAPSAFTSCSTYHSKGGELLGC